MFLTKWNTSSEGVRVCVFMPFEELKLLFGVHE